MAKITYLYPEKKGVPGFAETIEVRVWGQGGTEEQSFYIGSGLNYQANGNLWVEVIYSVCGAQIFYTRNFLHNDPFRTIDVAAAEEKLNELLKTGQGRFGFGDMLPETIVLLTCENITYEDPDGQKKQSSHCHLKISADTGAVFGLSGPGARSVDIALNYIDTEDGIRFMRELVHEIAAVEQGKHPDPASVAAGSSEWDFAHQLYQQTYDQRSADYREAYFDLHPLAEAFDGWLKMLPSGGHILDAGCGHGQPVIARLVEQGFQVTGVDLSPKMLERARQQFPQASFHQKPVTMIDDQAVYDGACSFNSLLYLDPIDLLHSINRLHSALKPGGLLFLMAFDSGPDWRGEPFGYRLDHWMWSWHYGMEEAASLLEEHGYFEVIETRVVQRDEGEAARIAQEEARQAEEEEAFNRRKAENPEAFPSFLPFFKTRIERSPYAYVVMARKREREKT